MERTRIRMFGRAEAQAATCACMKRAVGASDEAERVVAAAISEYYSNIAVVCTLRLSIRMFDRSSFEYRENTWQKCGSLYRVRVTFYYSRSIGWDGLEAHLYRSITVTTGVNIATLKYSYSCFAFIVSNDIENLMPVIYDFLYRVHELLRHSFTNARFTGLEV